MNQAAIWIFRVMILCLIGFELLNGFGVLHFSLVYTWQGLIVVALCSWIAAEVIFAHRKNMNISWLLALLFIAVFLDTCGDLFHFYSLFDHYDKFLHFFNSSVITYVVSVVLKDKIQKANIDKPFHFAIVVAISSFFGILYEIEEFLEDVFINKRQLRLGDGFDTAGDLVANVVGCIIMALILFFIMKKRGSNTPGKPLV